MFKLTDIMVDWQRVGDTDWEEKTRELSALRDSLMLSTSVEDADAIQKKEWNKRRGGGSLAWRLHPGFGVLPWEDTTTPKIASLASVSPQVTEEDDPTWLELKKEFSAYDDGGLMSMFDVDSPPVYRGGSMGQGQFFIGEGDSSSCGEMDAEAVVYEADVAIAGDLLSAYKKETVAKLYKNIAGSLGIEAGQLPPAAQRYFDVHQEVTQEIFELFKNGSTGYGDTKILSPALAEHFSDEFIAFANNFILAQAKENKHLGELNKSTMAWEDGDCVEGQVFGKSYSTDVTETVCTPAGPVPLQTFKQGTTFSRHSGAAPLDKVTVPVASAEGEIPMPLSELLRNPAMLEARLSVDTPLPKGCCLADDLLRSDNEELASATISLSLFPSSAIPTPYTLERKVYRNGTIDYLLEIQVSEAGISNFLHTPGQTIEVAGLNKDRNICPYEVVPRKEDTVPTLQQTAIKETTKDFRTAFENLLRILPNSRAIQEVLEAALEAALEEFPESLEELNTLIGTDEALKHAFVGSGLLNEGEETLPEQRVEEYLANYLGLKDVYRKLQLKKNDGLITSVLVPLKKEGNQLVRDVTSEITFSVSGHCLADFILGKAADVKPEVARSEDEADDGETKAADAEQEAADSVVKILSRRKEYADEFAKSVREMVPELKKGAPSSDWPAAYKKYIACKDRYEDFLDRSNVQQALDGMYKTLGEGIQAKFEKLKQEYCDGIYLSLAMGGIGLLKDPRVQQEIQKNGTPARLKAALSAFLRLIEKAETLEEVNENRGLLLKDCGIVGLIEKVLREEDCPNRDFFEQWLAVFQFDDREWESFYNVTRAKVDVSLGAGGEEKGSEDGSEKKGPSLVGNSLFTKEGGGLPVDIVAELSPG